MSTEALLWYPRRVFLMGSGLLNNSITTNPQLLSFKSTLGSTASHRVDFAVNFLFWPSFVCLPEWETLQINLEYLLNLSFCQKTSFHGTCQMKEVGAAVILKGFSFTFYSVKHKGRYFEKWMFLVYSGSQ